jgi:hypothetical protein
VKHQANKGKIILSKDRMKERGSGMKKEARGHQKAWRNRKAV